MSDTELKSAFEGVQKVVTEMRSTFEENLQKRDVLLEERQKKLDAEFVQIRSQMDELEKSAKRAAAAAEQTNTGLTEEQKRHSDEFKSYMRRGIETGEVLTRATQATLGNDAEGGYVASPAVQAAVERLLLVTSPMRTIASVQTITASSLKIPVDRLGANSGWVGENEARPQTLTPDLGQIEPPMGEIYAMAAATQTLLDDAAVNIEQWLATSIAERFDQQEGAAFIASDGVKKPRGFLAETTTAQTGLADVAWNSIGFAISGSATGFAPSTAETADGFTRVIGLLKPGYRGNARFVMNRMTEANIARLKDSTGQPLWRMSLRDGLPAQLMGYPVTIMDDMPDIADGAFPVAFGDFQRGYQIVDRVGIRTLRDPFTQKPFVLFYVTKRVGGATKRHEAIKLLRTSAS